MKVFLDAIAPQTGACNDSRGARELDVDEVVLREAVVKKCKEVARGVFPEETVRS